MEERTKKKEEEEDRSGEAVFLVIDRDNAKEDYYLRCRRAWSGV